MVIDSSCGKSTNRVLPGFSADVKVNGEPTHMTGFEVPSELVPDGGTPVQKIAAAFWRGKTLGKATSTSEAAVKKTRDDRQPSAAIVQMVVVVLNSVPIALAYLGPKAGSALVLAIFVVAMAGWAAARPARRSGYTRRQR